MKGELEATSASKLSREITVVWKRHWHTIIALAVFLTIVKAASQQSADIFSFITETLAALVISLAVSLFCHWVYRMVVDHLAAKASE